MYVYTRFRFLLQVPTSLTVRSAKALSYITKMRFHSDAQNQASSEEVQDRYKELRDRLKKAGVALHIVGKGELWTVN